MPLARPCRPSPVGVRPEREPAEPRASSRPRSGRTAAAAGPPTAPPRRPATARSAPIRPRSRRGTPAARSPRAAPPRVIGPTSSWWALSTAASCGNGAGAEEVRPHRQDHRHAAPRRGRRIQEIGEELVPVPLEPLAAPESSCGPVREHLLELVDDDQPAGVVRRSRRTSGRHNGRGRSWHPARRSSTKASRNSSCSFDVGEGDGRARTVIAEQGPSSRSGT